MTLETYQSKRNFKKAPESRGKVRKTQLQPLLNEHGSAATPTKTRRAAKTRSTAAIRSSARRPTATAAAPPAKSRRKRSTREPSPAHVPGAMAELMPAQVEPMLAKLVDRPFSDPAWLFETKWDGVRALCYIDQGRVRFVSRQQHEMGARYPELAGIAGWVKARQAILDGEIVAFDEQGRSSFQRLQTRLGLDDAAKIQRRAGQTPVVYCIFDLLYYDGFNVMPGALIHRKALLRDVVQWNDRLRYSEHVLGAGEQLFETARQQGWEGIVAKRQDSAYVERRSSDWLKLKTVQRQEAVIGGYTQPRGTRELFGALVVGVYRQKELHYVGHVGGGFNRELLRQIYQRLQPLHTNQSPFESQPPAHEPVQWVKPELVCEVKFGEWTADQRMRMPIFLGLRDDKAAREVTLEEKQSTQAEVQKAETAITVTAAQVKLIPSPAADQALPAGTFFKQRKFGGDQVVVVEGQPLSFTHLDKLYWPDEHHTKADLLRYYFQIADTILPHLENRPLILKRYPEGITRPPFFQHNVDAAPGFVETCTIEVEDGHHNNYVLVNNRATLLYLAQMGDIEQHAWLSSAADLDHPDRVVFDLDPGKVEFGVVCQVALALQRTLGDLSLECYAKTSSAEGLHVYVPIERSYTFDQTASFAEQIATRVARANSTIATVNRSIKGRPRGTVYIDYLQNARGKAVVAPYSVRARPGAPVSAPLKWSEIKRGPQPAAFTIKTMPARLARTGDLFINVLTKPQALDDALQCLAQS